MKFTLTLSVVCALLLSAAIRNKRANTRLTREIDAQAQQTFAAMMEVAKLREQNKKLEAIALQSIVNELRCEQAFEDTFNARKLAGH